MPIIDTDIALSMYDRICGDFKCVLPDPCEGSSRKVATNIPLVDAMTRGGLTPGLHCLTAGPGTGKTMLCSSIAYLAALDGRNVTYITDEVSPTEVWMRLASRKMEVDRLIAGGEECVPCWSELDDVLHSAALNGNVDAVAAIGDALYDVTHACKLDEDYGKVSTGTRRDGTQWTRVNHYTKGCLTVLEMGPRLPSHEVEKAPWDLRDEGFNVTRYLSSYMDLCASYKAEHNDGLEYDNLMEWLGYPNLLIIDPVNSMRLFSAEYAYKHENWQWDVHDRHVEPREKMDATVDALDNWSREMDVAVLAVFHGNMTRGDNQVKVIRHPSMGDFKESSRIEYRAVTAWELVPSSKMGWSGHPTPPTRDDLVGEPVGLFPLKLRGGECPKPNECVWLSFDGAHNLIQPYDLA